MHSIAAKIFTLPEETVLYSGHTAETTVGAEKSFYSNEIAQTAINGKEIAHPLFAQSRPS